MAKLVLLMLLSLPATTFNLKAVSHQPASTHQPGVKKAPAIFVPLDILKIR
jgi:hypothetical protein